MKTLLALGLLLLAGACGGGPAARAAQDEAEPAVRTVTWLPEEALAGWRRVEADNRFEVQHTEDGGKTWQDASPPALVAEVRRYLARGEDASLGTPASFCALDALHAWLAIVPHDADDGGKIIVVRTADGGRHWQELACTINAETVTVTFVDAAHGFLLGVGGKDQDDGAKKFYGTADGGEHWGELAAPAAPACTEPDVTFRSPTEGWITATPAGDDHAPLYHTTDGGQTWETQVLPVPLDFRGGDADTAAPVFLDADNKVGYLPVTLSRHDPKSGPDAEVNYETVDGGKTWHLPKSGVYTWP